MPAEKHFDEAGIHLVSSASAPKKRRLTLGSYFADIVSANHDELRYYYNIQRPGSAEIIEKELFDSFEDAERAAQKALQRWNWQDLQKRAAS